MQKGSIKELIVLCDELEKCAEKKCMNNEIVCAKRKIEEYAGEDINKRLKLKAMINIYDEDGKTDFLCSFSLLLSFFSFCIAGVNGLIEKQEYSLYILLFLIIIIVLLVIYLVNSNKTNARKKWKHYLKVVLEDIEKEK